MFYGVWGVAPSGMRAAAPQLTPSQGKGFGVRDREFTLFLKNRLFYKLVLAPKPAPVFYKNFIKPLDKLLSMC